jgi:hypothetical protein
MKGSSEINSMSATGRTLGRSTHPHMTVSRSSLCSPDSLCAIPNLCEPHHGMDAADPPIAAVAKYLCFVFRMFQSARFCACSSWADTASVDSDAIGETNETRNSVPTSLTGSRRAH